MKTNLNEIAKNLVNLTTIEALELAQILRLDYGIEIPQVKSDVVVETPVKVVEQTEFDVLLVNGGATKLQVVKVVKNLMNNTLVEAKQMVDSAPMTLKSRISRADAESIKNELEAVGAEINIK